MTMAGRLALWFLCGEWLLLCRFWFAPRVFLSLLAVLALRYWVLFTVLPNWFYYFLTLYGTVCVVMLHLLLTVITFQSGRHRLYQAAGASPYGTSWMRAVSRNDRVTGILETLAAAAIVIALVTQSDGWIKLYSAEEVLRDIRALLASMGIEIHAMLSFGLGVDRFIDHYHRMALFVMPVCTIVAFFVHNLLEVRQPRPAAARQEFFHAVREQSRRMPNLPSVKELADELVELYLDQTQGA